MVSHYFKNRFPARWFRAYNLPEAKQYATTREETLELLRRQNTLLQDVIGLGTKCIVVGGDYSELSGGMALAVKFPGVARHFTESVPAISMRDLDPDWWEEGDDPYYLRIGYGEHILKSGSLDYILLLVADDKVDPFFVISPDRGRLFAPYDGGVDLILKDESERDKFKAKYADWYFEPSVDLENQPRIVSD